MDAFTLLITDQKSYLTNAKQHTVSPNVFVCVCVDGALTDRQHAALESVWNSIRQLVSPVHLDVALRWTHRPVQLL